MTTKASIAQTPKELVWTLNKAKLYRYIPVLPKEKRHPIPLLLVFALMNRPYILDLRPGHSFVEYMVNEGYDLYLLDWGAPGPEDKHLKFDDYTLDYMPRAIRKLKAISGVGRVQSPGLVHRSDPHHHLRRPAWRRRLAQPDFVDRSAGLFQQAGPDLRALDRRTLFRCGQSSRGVWQYARRDDRLRGQGAQAGRKLRRKLCEVVGQHRRSSHCGIVACDELRG